VGRVHVGRLAVEAAVCRFFELAPGTGGASRGLLHVHASQVAAISSALADRAGADAEAAHLAGLLHDLGKLVMPLAFGEDELDAVAHEHPMGRARALLEQERFGVDHAHAGAVFAREAFLEARVFNAIGAHHSTEVPSLEAACVQVADNAVHLLLDLRADAEVLDRALAELGMSGAVLEDVVPAAIPTLAPSVGGLAGRVAALERAATTDEITGLLTGPAWLAEVRSKLDAGRCGVVLVADVQGLRALDERHGYAAGNVVLSELARILARRGTAGRLGGDELAVWAPVAPGEGESLAGAVHADIVAGLAERGVSLEVLVGSAPAPVGADAGAVLQAATAAARPAAPGAQRAA
jgi:putative nucleotidyltransferase with HDIG domain